MLAVGGQDQRLTRFWGYVDHNHKDYEETYQKTQEASPSHPHHPLSKGVANRHIATAPRAS